jgi:hypothetical protein
VLATEIIINLISSTNFAIIDMEINCDLYILLPVPSTAAASRKALRTESNLLDKRENCAVFKQIVNLDLYSPFFFGAISRFSGEPAYQLGRRGC